MATLLRHHRHFVRTAERYRQEGDTAELLSKLRYMNLVFTVTAGRTGTRRAQFVFTPTERNE